jgi:cold shock CspA family protein
MSVDLICLGRVKWFDNKKGYGIVQILDGQVKGVDVFAHHASIVTGEEQYRYLVSGEYVSCGVVSSVNKTIQHAATNIKGVLGGPLMCETIREQKMAKDAYEKEASKTVSSEKPLAKETKNIIKEVPKNPKPAKNANKNKK